ncbi:ABC transporter ATP-binding protein [Paraburkholderia phenoliruptrix]|uniref:ABC transporter ATP-binding protein n=1 Tax=Paraburkholderia phenoliruptrix TaxID=252970 RepID=UPI002869860C|nr:ABC transporter ATP-binding protein [Paraburkholderia phenoliruptrix]WMY10925.1 ABC transporter ATP-binding protein [Paraburkholderia phenoliruptrix]
MTTGDGKILLDIEDLRVDFAVLGGIVNAVKGVSLQVRAGETLGLVGESGSGKSVTTYGLVGLLASNGTMTASRVTFDGIDILGSKKAAQAIRGKDVSFIFQNPRAALNPIRTIGRQVEDALEAGRRPPKDRRERRERAVALLESVKISKAADRMNSYPHELSGGMCQRVLIAMALAAEPRLLVADEPTTGLDATTQKAVMDIISELSEQRGLSTILITHDLGLAARYCKRLAVMRLGELVEAGPAQDVLQTPKHAYTQRLIAATPRRDGELADLIPASGRPDVPNVKQVSATDQPLLTARKLRKTYKGKRGLVHNAVQEINFTVRRGHSLGIVGESGSGKTTTARMLARLLDPTDGSILFDGHDLTDVDIRRFALSPWRRKVQVVFQDPMGSLNPRFTAFDAIANPLRRAEPGLSANDERTRVGHAADRAGLPRELLLRYPHQMSGGQQARVGIARALVVQPEVIIFDEPTSALDVSVQAVLLNQLDTLRREEKLSFVFVSHDLNVVRMMCEEVLVMKDGAVVERGLAKDVLSNPQHPYTKTLVDAIPSFGEAA